MQTKKIARAVVLVAISVALSPFFIPIGISKCFPAQHMVNVISAVMLGPAYAVSIAFVAAVIRNLMGLGTLLAFPGGMIGALLAGIAYAAGKQIYLAALGEVFGTGLLGALVSVAVVGPLLMGKTMPVVTMIVAFSVSSIGGAVLGIVAINVLRKVGVWTPSSK
jgi:energy-coupling factor transport system ATP-binding protein